MLGLEREYPLSRKPYLRTMRFHREGWVTLILATGFLVLSLLFLKWLQVADWIFFAFGGISIILLMVVIQFFRNPIRKTPLDSSIILAPCDGKVVVIEQVYEKEFLKKECRQISIFMNPFNVHVNRNPIGGEVMYSEYHSGKYLVAWHPKSSEENERTTVVVRHAENHSDILFRQIAGALARRVVKYVKVGDKVQQGAEMGFIKFGSRMDVFIPLEAEVLINLQQKTTGGITPIARFKQI